MVSRRLSLVQCGLEQIICGYSTTSNADFQLIPLILNFCYIHTLVHPSSETLLVSVQQIGLFLISAPFSRHCSVIFFHSKSLTCLFFMPLYHLKVYWNLLSADDLSPFLALLIHHLNGVQEEKKITIDKYVTLSRKFLFSFYCAQLSKELHFKSEYC